MHACMANHHFFMTTFPQCRFLEETDQKVPGSTISYKAGILKETDQYDF
jgi:hypothetical protein